MRNDTGKPTVRLNWAGSSHWAVQGDWPRRRLWADVAKTRSLPCDHHGSLRDTASPNSGLSCSPEILLQIAQSTLRLDWGIYRGSSSMAEDSKRNRMTHRGTMPSTWSPSAAPLPCREVGLEPCKPRPTHLLSSGFFHKPVFPLHAWHWKRPPSSAGERPALFTGRGLSHNLLKETLSGYHSQVPTEGPPSRRKWLYHQWSLSYRSCQTHAENNYSSDRSGPACGTE